MPGVLQQTRSLPGCPDASLREPRRPATGPPRSVSGPWLGFPVWSLACGQARVCRMAVSTAFALQKGTQGPGQEPGPSANEAMAVAVGCSGATPPFNVPTGLRAITKGPTGHAGSKGQGQMGQTLGQNPCP